MIGFSYCDWDKKIDDRQSIIGYAFNIGSGVIGWSNKKQNIVPLSSAEAEYQAMCEVTCEEVCLRRLLQDAKENKKMQQL